ncbi:unnamed protein product [Strongylus vulgaris]|uniref:Uncharacterized protein n=1 Tax=Strongylus vulgaris TaxID=40348 RepID=A0A3P7JC83_STRVU|nr:unnamed protein product [Strongylus vulgaris]
MVYSYSFDSLLISYLVEQRYKAALFRIPGSTMIFIWYSAAALCLSSAIADPNLTGDNALLESITAHEGVKVTTAPRHDDCPGRSSLRHLCLPCKTIVHSWRSTMERVVMVRKVGLCK